MDSRQLVTLCSQSQPGPLEGDFLSKEGALQRGKKGHFEDMPWGYSKTPSVQSLHDWQLGLTSPKLF